MILPSGTSPDGVPAFWGTCSTPASIAIKSGELVWSVSMIVIVLLWGFRDAFKSSVRTKRILFASTGVGALVGSIMLFSGVFCTSHGVVGRMEIACKVLQTVTGILNVVPAAAGESAERKKADPRWTGYRKKIWPILRKFRDRYLPRMGRVAEISIDLELQREGSDSIDNIVLVTMPRVARSGSPVARVPSPVVLDAPTAVIPPSPLSRPSSPSCPLLSASSPRRSFTI